jgi:hypothetical protein
MNALTTAEAASVERPRQRYFRPEAHESGLKFLRQELLEDRPRRITISRRIATLLREREANKEALEAASARFLRPAEPAELKVTYRGAFGPLKIEVDPEWIREMLPDCSPRSRRGRRLRKLLRLHEEHNALIWAGRQISGIGPLVEERKRIEEELEAVAKEARTLDAYGAVSGPANAALRAAALLAVKLGAFYEHKEAPRVLEVLLKVAGAA